MLLYVAIVAGSWIVTRLPQRAAYVLGSIAGRFAYTIARGPRRNLQSNLSVVLGLPCSSREVRRRARRVFESNAMNWTDTLRLARTTKENVQDRVRVEGWDLIPAALGEGRGLILLGLHLGNMDLVGQIVAARGYTMTVPVEPTKPAALFHRTQALRQSLGLNAVPATNAGRSLLRALKRGEIVGVAADRNIARTGVQVQFFGRPAVVSKGPAWLARHSEAPVLLGVGLRDRDGRFRGKVVGPIPVQRTDDERADLQDNAQAFTTAAEQLIRDYPDQWAMFVPVWEFRAKIGDSNRGSRARMPGSCKS